MVYFSVSKEVLKLSQIRFNFDRKKALEVLIYTSKKEPNYYDTLKIIYFADRYHLEKYGRFICGDNYIAMKSGPVPSGIYDIINDVKLKRNDEFNNDFTIINEYTIKPLREPNMKKLSKSDIEAIDKSFEENKDLTYIEKKNKSHDKSYKNAKRNDLISIEEIVKTLPNSEVILEHLKEIYSA